MYSQNNEETYILAAAERSEAKGRTRRFLDIGAYHPTLLSNTRALWERGWSGIFIEASPGPVRCLVQEYGNDPRAIVIAAAVGVTGGLVEMKVTDDALSTSVHGVHQLWKDAGGYYGTLTVPILTLDAFFYQFGGDFSFISVDTEGTSVDIFREILRIGPRPHYWCIEHDQRFSDIMEIAAEYNYELPDKGAKNAQNVVLEVKR